MENEKRFIIWDPRDGLVRWGSDDGTEDQIVSDGLIGRVGEDNVYLTTYAGYPGGKTHRDLSVGERIKGVVFRLSGSKGVYEVHRVK